MNTLHALDDEPKPPRTVQRSCDRLLADGEDISGLVLRRLQVAFCKEGWQGEVFPKRAPARLWVVDTAFV